MSFGYAQLYSNGLNSTSQIRRSADMVYQRGGTYEVVLTGTTNQSSMELSVGLYANDNLVGKMALVPYDISLSGSTYYYKFNIRPYNYLQNYINTEHYQYYWGDDFDATTQDINVNAAYPNTAKINVKYGYQFFSGATLVQEFPTGLVNNDYNHFTYIPESVNETGFFPQAYTSTGKYFDYVGGTFEFDNNYFLPNFDQEVGTVIGSGFTTNVLDIYTRFSPISQFLMDYPTVPEQSQTARFLTEAPRIQYIQIDENYVLYYLNGQTGDRQVIEADWAVYEFYNENNVRVGRQTQQLNKLGTAFASPSGYDDTLKRFALPCGPQDIYNLFSGVSFNDVAYYKVQLCYGYPTWEGDRTSTGPIGPLSEIFYFYLYDNCLPESTRLVWLNDRGGYDYFTFQSYRQDTKKIERQSYDNRYYATNLASPDRNIARSTKTFDTNVTQEIVLESDYLSTAQAEWIESLFYSPQVYIMNSDYVSPIDRPNKIYKDLRPVQVISSDVDTLTKKHKKLNKYRITLKTGDSFFVNKGF